MTELGSAIRRLLDERGVSLRATAKQAHWDAGYISQVINGHRKGSKRLAQDLDTVLGAGGELADIWEASEGPQLPQRIAEATVASFPGTADTPAESTGTAEAATGTLTAWDSAPARAPFQMLTAEQAGLDEIAQLEAITDMFRVWDHQRGGALGRRAATGQLADVADLLSRPHPDPLRRRLLAVAARMSIIVGHMTSDAGLDGHAARYLDLALDAAREAGDGDLGARAVNAIARRIIDVGRSGEAVTLLRHARASLRDVRPSVTALLFGTEAWASAKLGDYDEMAPCLEQASELASGAGNVGPAEVAGVAGACYETLAAASPNRRAASADQAARYITTALQLRDPYYVRSRVFDLAGLARIRLMQGELDEAMAAAGQALDSAVTLRSSRTARRLHGLAIDALTQYPSARPVGDYVDQVRTRLPVS